MRTLDKRAIDELLAAEYSFNVIADPDGGYVVVYPDLPGCITQADALDEVATMAEDVRRGWIETALKNGMPIPPPSYPPEYSGKFVLRLPRSLHRSLAESAGAEGVSLNQYVSTLLACGDAQARIERKLDALAAAGLTGDDAVEADTAGRTPAPRRRKSA
jgi:antitoxin HicB